MKKLSSAFLLIVLSASFCSQAWAQAPSTEGTDFWVTFLRADDDSPSELKLTISARDSCSVTIENTNTNYTNHITITKDNLCPELVIDKRHCYSSNNNQLTYTALHVTSDKEISLFAGNYRNKSFDAANILPTSALLDDYVVQTYPASDHENKEQGCHFAIVAVEDGQTIVDYNLTTTANVPGKDNSGSFVTLNKGQVCYIWSGKTKDDASDLSGSTIKARNGKKIAVFQGCPHTNVPNKVRNRDHIFSQAMPTAYWGTEFGITSSLLRRRDIVAVMAINDGTQVYINNGEGQKELVHTFDFNVDKKHYWTFEIGEYLAYCNSAESPYDGKLAAPLVVDSSCYLTTSCPAGVHLIMASNRYDLPTEDSPEPDSDPALLWISPIEQVIKDINFATYNEGINTHYVNIITSTSDIDSVKLDTLYIKEKFHPVMGNPDYSFARVTIKEGSHNLHSHLGFCAHVYGYGEKASYAYSCGSSTVQRSISLNDFPIAIDSLSNKTYCVGDSINMKLNIGNNDYQSVVWDFGDGLTYSPDDNATNNEKKTAKHAYNVPGWYDLKVTAVYINSCNGQKYTETMSTSFRVVRPVYEFVPERVCKEEDYTGSMKNDTIWPDETVECSDTIQIPVQVYKKKTSATINQEGRDSALVNGKMYYSSETIKWTTENINGCDSFVTCNLTIITCLDMDIENDSANQVACWGKPLDIPYTKYKGEIDNNDTIGSNVLFVYTLDGKEQKVNVALSEGTKNVSGTITLPTEKLAPGVHHGKIQAKDYYCSDLTMEFPIDITISYPDSIMKPKFGNTIALYQKGKGGNKGWDLDKSTFVWYHDGDSVATGPVYYTPKDANGVSEKLNGEYYVAITTNGKTILSCPKTFENGKDVTKGSSTVAPAAAPEDDNTPDPAKKVLQNRQIFIVRDGQTFNIYGQKVQ